MSGALENLQSILPVLPHAIDLLTSNIPASESFHTALHGGHSCVHHSDKTSTHTTPGLSNALNLPPSSRPRISPYPLTPLSTAHTLIKSHCKPLPPFLTKTPLDHILAQDIKSEIDIPSVPTSIVDGYAMTTTTPGIYTLTGHTLANGPPLDGLVRVNTGSPLSPQTIGVVMIEDTEVDSLDLSGNEERIKVKGCTPGLNIRKVGSDVSKGQVVLAKGELVSKYGGGEVGLLASIGVKEVMVYGKPRVGVLSTGDEVGKSVLDANRPALLAVLAGYGYESVDLGIVEDDVDKITEKIKNGLEKVDVLVTTGGVSMGEADFLKTVLERKLNGIIHFGRVNVKPGKPTTFATVGERLVFSLPGNPVSALVMFRVFVLPALRRLSGHSGEELWIKVKVKNTEKNLL